ncbi:uncharacterized protein PgNI_00761 [Pyricularia grisea]|uniref:Uncharacterized protein n=1 Tax=Pyricularia grisea TaxID=148305 RepID=A0A6P8BK47_PYRGI|nr:uncharacterized protein PgNI_00761 [Pyricularia grisea]TLD17271.1 hypothetical protein PgNI_00761 [Pyricularia grisea]
MDVQEPLTVIDAEDTQRIESSSGPGHVSNVESTAKLSLVGDQVALSRERVQNWQLATRVWNPLQLGTGEQREQGLQAFLQTFDHIMAGTERQESAQDGDGVGPGDHIAENTQTSAP